MEERHAFIRETEIIKKIQKNDMIL